MSVRQAHGSIVNAALAASSVLGACSMTASAGDPPSTAWTRQSAVPTHLNFSAVALASPAHGFAVGADGLIMETADAGATWTDHSVDTAGSGLNHVFFLDATRGWIVGNSAAVGPPTSFRSVDGGATWQPMSLPPGSWYFVRFVTNSFGWSTGNGGTAISTSGGQSWSLVSVDAGPFWVNDFTSDGQVGLGRAMADGLYRSVDAGATWSLVLPAVSSASARFLSPSVAVAATDIGMMRSTNAGQTWQAASSPATPSNMTMERLSDTAAIAWNVQGDTLRTTNAGVSWQAVDSIGGTHVWDGIYVLEAVGPSSAVAVTTLGKVIRTADAGATWQTVSPAGPTSGYPTMSLAALGGTVLGVGNAGIVQRSIDGGNTFAISSSGAGAVMWDLKAWDPQRAIAVGQDGTALITSNGGAPWLPQRPGLMFGAGQMLRGVAVLPGGFAVAVGLLGDMVRSDDYGQAWSDISPFIDTDFADVDFITPQLGWVIATYPKNIYRTVDGGATWQAQLFLPGLGFAYASIDFVDASNGWATGPNTSIFRTVDGGASWSTVAIPNPYPDQATPTDIRFVDQNTGWLVGEFGLIMKSTDGGLTWSVQRFDINAPTLTKISPLSASEAFVSSHGGSVLHTADGGASWETLATGIEESAFPALNTVAATTLPEDGVRVWAAGDRGTILRRPEAPTPVPGDSNGDGSVDVADLLAIITAWGQCSPSRASCPADLNDDGVVNVNDLLLVLTNWGANN